MLVASDNTSVCTSNVKLLGLKTEISVQFNFCFKCFYEVAISKWTTDKQNSITSKASVRGKEGVRAKVPRGQALCWLR